MTSRLLRPWLPHEPLAPGSAIHLEQGTGLAVILAIALALRAVHLDARSYCFDEGFI